MKPDRLDKAATLAARDKPATLPITASCSSARTLTPSSSRRPATCTSRWRSRRCRPASTSTARNRLVSRPNPSPTAAVAKASRPCFNPASRCARTRAAAVIAKIREGIAGKLFMIKAQRHAGDDLDHDGSSADWFFNAKRRATSSWRWPSTTWISATGRRQPPRARGRIRRHAALEERSSRPHQHGRLHAQLRLRERREAFLHPGILPPGRMPDGGQYFHVYGTEGAVDLMNGTFYPRRPGPSRLLLAAASAGTGGEPHIAAFYRGDPHGERSPAADITSAQPPRSRQSSAAKPFTREKSRSGASSAWTCDGRAGSRTARRPTARCHGAAGA